MGKEVVVTISPIEADLTELFARQARSLDIGAPPPVDELGNLRVPTGRPVDRSSVRPFRPFRPFRPRQVVSLAAAVMLVFGAGALWWAFGARDDSTPAGVPEAPLMPVDPPLLVLDSPGWEMETFAQHDPSEFLRRNDPDQQEDGRRTTFIDPALGVSGPRITVSVSNSGTTGLDVAEQSVSVGGADGVLYDDGGEKLVRWTERSGNRLEAFGYSVTVDELIGAAQGMTVDDEGFPVAEMPLPLGLVALSGRDAELMHSSVQYRWVDASGRQIEVNLYPGGPTVLAQRADSCCDDGVQRREVDYQGSGATVQQDEYLIRLNQLRGFWLWEIDGSASLASDGVEGFADIEEFLDVVEQIRIADADVWRATLADTVVLRDEIDDVTDELSIFPMPTGAAAPNVSDGGFTTTRVAIAQSIAVQTACAWAQTFTSAVADEDADATGDALEVLRDVAAWGEIGAVPDRYPDSEVVTPVGGIRLAAELLAPFVDRFDTSGTSGDDELDRHQALWNEIPVGEVAEMLACT